jgi:hypothetical protein
MFICGRWLAVVVPFAIFFLVGQAALAQTAPGEEHVGVALAARAGFGVRSATGENLHQGNVSSSFSSSAEATVLVPFGRWLWLVTGLGFEPQGASYDSMERFAFGRVMEEVDYVQFPVLLRLEFSIAEASATVRFFASGGAALDVAVFKDGTYKRELETARLDSISWYQGFHDVNLAAVGAAGVELGLGAAPSFYVGIDCTARLHLFDEWGDDAGFQYGNNLRYGSIRVGLFVEYQMRR